MVCGSAMTMRILGVVAFLGWASTGFSADCDKAVCEYSQGAILARPIAITEAQAKSIISESPTEVRGTSVFFCQCMAGILSEGVTENTRLDLARLVLRESRHLVDRTGLEDLIFDCIHAANNSRSIQLTIELGTLCCEKKSQLLRCLHNAFRDTRVLAIHLRIIRESVFVLLDRKVATPDDIVHSLLPIVEARDVDNSRRFMALDLVCVVIVGYCPSCLVTAGDVFVSDTVADETATVCALIFVSNDSLTDLRECASQVLALLTSSHKRMLSTALCDRAVEIFIDPASDVAIRKSAIRLLTCSGNDYRGLPFEEVYLLVESDSVSQNSPAFHRSLVDFIIDRGIRTDREVAILEKVLKQVGLRSQLGKDISKTLVTLRNEAE